MSQVTIYFGVAPAIAPIIGGWLFVHAGWHSIFWFLTAVGVALWLANFKLLPESLHVTHRQPFNVRNLMRGYWDLCSNPRFLLLALASGVPSTACSCMCWRRRSSSGTHLHLAPKEFFWFFILTITGIMGGSWFSGRLAGKITPRRQIRYGFTIMLLVSLVNVAANYMLVAHAGWALIPIAVFSFGWALMVPVVTLLVLDLAPERRGLVSSLQAVIGSTANGIVAGVIARWSCIRTRALSAHLIVDDERGIVRVVFVHRRWPETGRAVTAVA
jgi:DHA1 family bicyclomycin/chloramphenicol resistance-like MFS transporter